MNSNDGVMHRRCFLTGLGSVLVAPAFVHASSPMPVRGFVAVGKYAVPAGFNAYEASKWRSLMSIAWIQERWGRPISEKALEAIRTQTLPRDLRGSGPVG